PLGGGATSASATRARRRATRSGAGNPPTGAPAAPPLRATARATARRRRRGGGAAITASGGAKEAKRGYSRRLVIDRAGRFSGRWTFPALAALVLACAAGFAGRGAATDSVTVDEPSHQIAGYAALTLGDFRLSPDHPPLGRLLLALPLLAQPVAWKAEGSAAWRSGDFFTLGRDFFESWNDGQRLVRPSRAVAIGFLLALLLAIGAVARELFGPPGALLAMGVAAFDPAFLGHGHLATLDVPFALAALLTLWAAHRWLAAPSPGRLALLAAAFSAATLIKFSWFALVPALLILAVAARWGRGWKA